LGKLSQESPTQSYPEKKKVGASGQVTYRVEGERKKSEDKNGEQARTIGHIGLGPSNL